jgi:hypothetical protein
MECVNLKQHMHETTLHWLHMMKVWHWHPLKCSVLVCGAECCIAELGCLPPGHLFQAAGMPSRATFWALGAPQNISICVVYALLFNGVR